MVTRLDPRRAAPSPVPARPRGARAAVALLALVALCAAPVAFGAKPKPKSDALVFHSRAVVVVDATRDAVVLQRGGEAVRPIASITKLMTALVVLEANQPLDEPLAITAEDARATAKSSSRLAVGTRLTRGELLQLALMASENRAANALARHYPGGSDVFVAAMRSKAARLGMLRSRFVEPTGLSSGNVAPPSDLTRLVRAAAADPRIRDWSTAQSMVVDVRGRPTEFRTTDRLVRDERWSLVVQKTGYIQAAGRCLVLQMQLAGRSYVIVLLNSPGPAGRLADARRIHGWLQQRVARLEAGADQGPVADVIDADAVSHGG